MKQIISLVQDRRRKKNSKKSLKNGQVKVKSCVRSETYGQFRLLLPLLHLQSRVPARVYLFTQIKTGYFYN